VEDYRRALEKSAWVLRPEGRIIVMLLNPRSAFFSDRFHDTGSYVSKIKHKDLKILEDAIAESFVVRTEYFLGVKDNEVSESRNATDAALYVVTGAKRLPA
jgi:hypothetical protein